MENYNEKENKNLKLCVMICFILFSVFAGLYSQSIVYAQNASQTQQEKPAIYVSKELFEARLKLVILAARGKGLNPEMASAAYVTMNYYLHFIGGYSPTKLVSQLRRDGYISLYDKEVLLAFSYLDVDFKEQAYLSAKRYMSIFTTKEILEKWLTIDGYEKEEIDYAVKKMFNK